jgi:hypothetical protein
MPKKIGLRAAREKVLLSEAKHHQCRWILNRQGFGVYSICGLRVRSGSSFCGVHHDLVWGARNNEGNRPRPVVVRAA